MSDTKIDIDMEKCDAELKSKTIGGFPDNRAVITAPPSRPFALRTAATDTL